MSNPSSKISVNPFSRSALVALGLACLVVYVSAFVGARTSSGSLPQVSDDNGRRETRAGHEVPAKHTRSTAAARPAVSDTPRRKPAYPILNQHDMRITTQPRADDATSARRIANVSTEAIEQYMAGAPRDDRAAFEAGKRFEEIATARQFVADRKIECRGSVCRIALRFGTRSEVARIAGVRPVDGSEFTYKLVNEKDNATTLLVYRTSPGVTFDALLSEAPGQVASKTLDR